MQSRLKFLASMLAASALPFCVQAQDQAAAGEAIPQIVVSGEHQRDWDRGNRLEAEGLNELAGAERTLVQRSAAVVNAENARNTARQRAENARQSLENLRQREVLADPDEARRWAQSVKSAAEEWEHQDDQVRTHARSLERAIKRQATARDAVSQAQAKIDRGRALMHSAETASR